MDQGKNSQLPGLTNWMSTSSWNRPPTGPKPTAPSPLIYPELPTEPPPVYHETTFQSGNQQTATNPNQQNPINNTIPVNTSSRSSRICSNICLTNKAKIVWFLVAMIVFCGGYGVYQVLKTIRKGGWTHQTEPYHEELLITPENSGEYFCKDHDSTVQFDCQYEFCEVHLINNCNAEEYKNDLSYTILIETIDDCHNCIGIEILQNDVSKNDNLKVEIKRYHSDEIRVVKKENYVYDRLEYARIKFRSGINYDGLDGYHIRVFYKDSEKEGLSTTLTPTGLGLFNIIKDSLKA